MTKINLIESSISSKPRPFKEYLQFAHAVIVLILTVPLICMLIAGFIFYTMLAIVNQSKPKSKKGQVWKNARIKTLYVFTELCFAPVLWVIGEHSRWDRLKESNPLLRKAGTL